MKQRHKNFYIYTLLILATMTTLFCIFATTIRPTNVQLTDESGQKQNITLPFRSLSKPPIAKYTFTGILTYLFYPQHILTVVPDECVTKFEINDQNVPLKNIIHGKSCDNIEGFDIDISKYLKSKSNSFKIQTLDYNEDYDAHYNGWFGLSIKNSLQDLIYKTLFIALVLEINIVLFLFLNKLLKFSNILALLFVLGLMVRIIYLGQTGYGENTYDVLAFNGHLDYIKYVGDNWKLPEQRDGWEFHQAPLYYITAAIVYKLSSILGIYYPTLLQTLSLAYNTIFIIFGTLLFQLFYKKNNSQNIAAALLIFWPSSIINAIRIGNDTMYYTTLTIALYFLLRWITGKKDKHFYLAGLFTGLTIATKISGVILIGIFGIAFCIVWTNTKRKRTLFLKALFLISLILICSYFSIFRNIQAKMKDNNYSIINGTTGYLWKVQNSPLKVGNTICNYITFDAKIFMTKPFTSTSDDQAGRQYFWNFLLKSMLFGEFNFPSQIKQTIAIVLSVTSLQMIGFFCIGLITSIKKLSITDSLMLCWASLSFASLIYYRYNFPFASNGDFRFIFPIIIPGIYWYMLGINNCSQHNLKILQYFGYTLTLIFLIASILFFL